MADVSAEYISPDLLNDICEWMRKGNAAIKFDFAGHGKTERSFFRWMVAQATDAQRQDYARSYMDRADVLFEECLNIADDSTDDVMFLTAEDNDGDSGRAIIKHSAIQRARLRVDTRKWAIGKMNPKKYSDKIAIGGADDLPPIQAKVNMKIEWE